MKKNFIAYVKNDKQESHENVKFFDIHKFLSIIRECVMNCMFARWWWTFNIFLRSKINRRKIPSSFNADSSAMSKANTPVIRVYLQDLHKISGFRAFWRLYNLQMWLENGFGGMAEALSRHVCDKQFTCLLSYHSLWLHVIKLNKCKSTENL